MQFENTNWKRPDRRPLNADTWRHRIAAARSPAMTHIVSDLAFATAGMYPDLLWPLIDHVNSRDATEEPSPGRRGGEAELEPDVSFARGVGGPASRCREPAAVGRRPIRRGRHSATA